MAALARREPAPILAPKPRTQEDTSGHTEQLVHVVKSVFGTKKRAPAFPPGPYPWS